MAGNTCMSKIEHARRAILELIAVDSNGDWNVHEICERIYGHSDHLKREVAAEPVVGVGQIRS
jgi:hypothetical protein